MTSENKAWESFDPTSDALPESLLAITPEDGGRGVVVVTAVAPTAEDGEWSARVALRVAELCGIRGEAPMLIDLGLEEPTLHSALGESGGEGISDVFLFSASLQRVTRPVRDGAVRLVPAGTVVGDPARVLTHHAWGKLLGGELERGTSVVLHVPLAAAGADAIIALADAVVLMADPADGESDFTEDHPGPVVRLAPPGQPTTEDSAATEDWYENPHDTADPAVKVDLDFAVDAEPLTEGTDDWGSEANGEWESATDYGREGEADDEAVSESPDEWEGQRADDVGAEHSEADGEGKIHAAAASSEDVTAEMPREPGMIVIDTLAPELHAALREQTAEADRDDFQREAEDGESRETLDEEFAQRSSEVIDAVFTEAIPEPEEHPLQAAGEPQDDWEDNEEEERVDSSDDWMAAADEFGESAHPWEDRGDWAAEPAEEEEPAARTDRDLLDFLSDPGEFDADLVAAELEADSSAETDVSLFDTSSVENPFAKRSYAGAESEADDWRDDSLAEEYEGLPEVKDARRSRRSGLRVAMTVFVVVLGAGAIGLTTVRPTDDPEFDGGVRTSAVPATAAREDLTADPQMGDPLRALSRDDEEHGSEGVDDVQDGEEPAAEADSGIEDAGIAARETADGDATTEGGAATADETAADEAAGSEDADPSPAREPTSRPTQQTGETAADRPAATEAMAPAGAPAGAADRPSTTPVPDESTSRNAQAERAATTPTGNDAPSEPRQPSTDAAEARPAEQPAANPAKPPAANVADAQGEARPEAASDRPAEATLPTHRDADGAAATPEQPADEPAASSTPTRAPAETVAPDASAASGSPPAQQPAAATPAATGSDAMAPPPPSTRPSGLMAYGLEVGSHSRPGAARTQAASLQGQFPHLEFIEVPVRGDGGVTYRVLAGPAATASEAEGLRTSLTGFLGRAAASGATVRSTGLTFLLGAYEEYREAKGRIGEARARGIPAYLAEFPVSGGRVVYRVYAGAFASEAEAAALGALLQEAALGQTPLLERVGRPQR